MAQEAVLISSESIASQSLLKAVSCSITKAAANGQLLLTQEAKPCRPNIISACWLHKEI